MRILLAKAAYTENYGQLVPPLGLLYVSAALKRAGFSEVRLFEAGRHAEPAEAFRRELESFRPDVVGLSAITAEALSLHALAAAAAAFSPRPAIVAGGTHPTVYLEDCGADGNLDFIVRGEGEAAVVELVRALRDKSPFEGIKGLSFRRGGRLEHNPCREPERDLDSLPPPDWELAPPGSYTTGIPHSPLLYGQPYAKVLTSRGCPYACVYCHNTHGKAFRAHSPGRVVAEVKALREKYGVRNFEITDDIFNLDKARAKAILRGLAAGVPDAALFFSNGLRADVLDAELIDLLRAAGTKYVCVAVETASPGLQKKIGKHLDLGKLRENAALLVERGIFVNGFFMIGFPGETRRELAATVRFLLGLPIHTFMMSYCLAYEGTDLAAGVPPEKRVDPRRDTASYSSVLGFVNCSGLPAWQLIAAKLAANLLFYFFFPARWYRIIRDLPYRSPGVLALLFRKLLTRSLLPR